MAGRRGLPRHRSLGQAAVDPGGKMGAWRPARVLGGAVLAMALAALPCFAALAAPASAEGQLAMSARINGQSLEGSNPVALYPGRTTPVHLSFTNGSGSPVTVGAVRLQGEVMALPLFTYETTVNIAVPAHQTATLEFPLSLEGLEGQATGLIPSSIVALRPNGDQVAAQGMVADVRGSILSLYGLFALAVAAITVVSLAGALIGLRRGRLSPKRWVRALQFLVPGVGTGLIIIFTFSATRLFVPGPEAWIPILAGCAAAGLVGGFLSPAPRRPSRSEGGPEDQQGTSTAQAPAGLPAGLPSPPDAPLASGHVPSPASGPAAEAGGPAASGERDAYGTLVPPQQD